MALFNAAQRSFVESISRLCVTNPFSPQRLAVERAALGEAWEAERGVWSYQPQQPGERKNIGQLIERAQTLLEQTRAKLIEHADATPRELELYEDLVLHQLYSNHRQGLAPGLDMAESPARRRASSGAGVLGWKAFRAEFAHYLQLPGVTLPSGYEAGHVFACCHQLRRAFLNIFEHLLGSAACMGELRQAVWQSIFTSDMHRYFRGLYRNMADFATLITGPTGTGKELVARAIGCSLYIPFDEAAGRFRGDCDGAFFPLNLSALSPTLVESELFGHVRGAFTGALQDRTGWLEQCPPHGAVFLDEIGELTENIQVKLLRVLQQRQFARIGDTKLRDFTGKIVAATNRNLAQRMHEAAFRSDLYYRLCSDVLTTPSLRQQFNDAPGDLARFVHFILQRILEGEVTELAESVAQQIEAALGADYAWPGNFRELEQCVRNLLVHGRYQPPVANVEAVDAGDALARDIRHGTLSADELLTRYVQVVYGQCGSYVETARRLQLDRRTVKARVDAGAVG